jgi:hypothetical protein
VCKLRCSPACVLLRVRVRLCRCTGACVWTRVRLCARLTVEVHGAGAVRVDFGNHLVQLVLGDVVVQGAKDVAEVGDVDVAVALKISSPLRYSPVDGK